MDLAGDLSVHIKTKDNYQPDNHQFPVTRADLQLSNGRVKTKYYPDPLEHIQVSALVTNTDGSIKDLAVAFTPISFLRRTALYGQGRPERLYRPAAI
jgi:AsmA protein